MSEDRRFWEAVGEIRARDDRYAVELYRFVVEALEYTITVLGERRHVSASELLDGMCRYAKERFGLLAHTVLEGWGMESARDIGLVVYHLVDAGVLSRQDSDSLEDFENGYDLKKALEEDYFD